MTYCDVMIMMVTTMMMMIINNNNMIKCYVPCMLVSWKKDGKASQMKFLNDARAYC